MPVVHPIRDAQHTFKADILGQNRAGDFTNELVSTVETVYLPYNPGILNIADQRHGAYLLIFTTQIDDRSDAGEAQSGKSGITLVLEENRQLGTSATGRLRSATAIQPSPTAGSRNSILRPGP